MKTTQLTDQEKYMKEALRQAKKAYALGEVPIGCVIVHEGKIIGRGYNRRNTDKNTLAHAEITAINKASRKLGDWRLEGCTLYVTLEPCQMCAGAIVQARIDEVVMACMNPKAGCGGSILNILEMPEFNHQVKVTRGILEEECSHMLTQFFKELRIRNKAEKELRKEQEQQKNRNEDLSSGQYEFTMFCSQTLLLIIKKPMMTLMISVKLTRKNTIVMESVVKRDRTKA